MKTKKLRKKLELEKKIVSSLPDLNEKEMIRLQGGKERSISNEDTVNMC